MQQAEKWQRLWQKMQKPSWKKAKAEWTKAKLEIAEAEEKMEVAHLDLEIAKDAELHAFVQVCHLEVTFCNCASVHEVACHELLAAQQAAKQRWAAMQILLTKIHAAAQQNPCKNTAFLSWCLLFVSIFVPNSFPQWWPLFQAMRESRFTSGTWTMSSMT